MRALLVLALLGACEKPTTPSGKRATIAAMLAHDDVLIYLDARRPGVVVPASHAREPDLVLRIGSNLTPPEPDLVVDDRGIAATMMFDGKPFHVSVPWSALYGAQLEDQTQRKVWNADIPADLPTK